MSRRPRRNRGRPVSKAAPPSGYTGTSGVTYTPDQVAAMMTAQRQLEDGRARSQALPSSPYWETSPFGPGRRLIPAPINVPRQDSGRAEPRLWEYPVSWNLQIDDTWHVPWDVLRRAADVPLFRKCIERRKSICQNEFAVIVDPVAVAREVQATGSAKTDVEAGLRQKYLSEIARVTDWLRVPDRKNDLEWPDWCSLLFENRLKYDAAVVYPRKTYGGDLFALEVIDGRTVKPLLDEYGGRPMPPLPAYQQIMYGFPRGEWMATVDPGEVDPLTGRPVVPGGYPGDTLYYRRSIFRSESPYGMSPTEIALLDGLLWMRRMGWMMAEYQEGMTPVGMIELEPNDWTPTQWDDYGRMLQDKLGGNTAERQKWPFLPPGSKFVQGEQVAEKYSPDYDLFLIKLVAGDYGLPASEVGFTEAGALGASFHEGEENILWRQTRQPDANWLESYATKLAIRELAMPNALKIKILGLEWEDEAAADAVSADRVSGGRSTLNEDRGRRGEPTYDFPEADMPMLITPRGVVFLEGASTAAPPGTLIVPAHAPPAGMPGAPAQQAGEEDPEGEDSGGGENAASPSPAAKAAELSALRKWLARHPQSSRLFACKALTAADWDGPADPRIVFKAGGHPKVPCTTGLAGSVT